MQAAWIVLGGLLLLPFTPLYPSAPDGVVVTLLVCSVLGTVLAVGLLTRAQVPAPSTSPHHRRGNRLRQGLAVLVGAGMCAAALLLDLLVIWAAGASVAG